ncbi:hypothetical protein R1flu_004962 [Riccia fluitans]|uniref:Uncharacterized protein n=1 Tax=Riccia fluitans TaxID=41844 RepID=A0ABD1YRT2_9MARC
MLKSSGYFATKFKLHLAPASSEGTQLFSVSPLPQGLTVKHLITDYLRCTGEFIMKKLDDYYEGVICKKDLKWCLTVPALWDNAAKQQMLDCAEMAGLRKLKDVKFTKGSKFLLVDAGGGTVDLVVHKKVKDSGINVKEVACSTSLLSCGVCEFICRRGIPASHFGTYQLL